MAVEVVGYDTTTVTLDPAAGNRILAEETLSGTAQYLHGHDCLGGLPDAEGLVRQGIYTWKSKQ